MRAIEFRAWDKLNEQMGPLRQIAFHTKEAYYGIERHGNIDHTHQPVSFINIDVMQFTGLKDKNGVKIFEGDIVSNEVYKKIPISHIGVLKWFPRAGSFCIDYNESCKIFSIYNYKEGHEDETTDLLFLENENLEVIGNIHENPELIKPI